MMINRKEFISLSSLGIVSLFFPTYYFSKAKQNISPATDLNFLLKKAADLRKQEKYNQAKVIYQQIFIQFPTEIRAYDGMRKTLLGQKKNWEVILMLRAALLINPSNDELKQRLYKEYFTASLGNKKVASLINHSGRLLTEVQQKFSIFVQAHPNNINIQKQYLKISKLLEWNADTTNPKNNSALIFHRKQQYLKYKARFDSFTPLQVESKLNILLAKPYAIDRKMHIRELYISTFRTLRSEKNNEAALSKALNYLNTIDNSDPLFLKFCRDLSKLLKKNDVLISLEINNHSVKNSFWSALALLDAYIRKAEQQRSALPYQTSTLLSFIESRIDTPSQKFEVNARSIKMDLLNNQTDSAKNKILNLCNRMGGVTNSHTIDRVNLLVAHYYIRIGHLDRKNSIVKIAINPQSYIDNSDVIVKAVAFMNLNRSYAKSLHLQNLKKLISNL